MASSKDIEKYRNWLIEKKGITRTVASNYISRLKRVEKELNEDIDFCIETKNDYITLMEKTQTYIHKKEEDPKKRYALGASLRSAVKNYAIFKNPEMEKFYNDVKCYNDIVYISSKERRLHKCS